MPRRRGDGAGLGLARALDPPGNLSPHTQRTYTDGREAAVILGAVVDLDVLRRELLAQEGVGLAVLFGSRARGTAGRGSDVDLGVTGLDVDRQAMLGVSLSRALGCQVDIVDLDTSPPLLRFEIARDGQVVVERRAHAWSDFQARAMVDWWDWAPTARLFQEAAARRLRERVGHGSS